MLCHLLSSSREFDTAEPELLPLTAQLIFPAIEPPKRQKRSEVPALLQSIKPGEFTELFVFTQKEKEKLVPLKAILGV